MPKQRPAAKSLAPKSPGEQTETGKQIEGALGGIGEGLSALFSEKEAPPERERPAIPMDYVEKGTHGQNWDLIRMGMDAQKQKSSMTQVDHAVESQYRHRKPQGEDELYRPAYGETGWVAERSKGSRGHFDAGHV